MWPFNGKEFTKDNLGGFKTVYVNGFRFKIRRVNPLIDFESSQLPSLFTDNEWSVNNSCNPPQTPELIQKVQKQMYLYLEAGVIEPKLVPIGKDDKKGKEEGITVEDLFRDPSLGAKLFNEIILHSTSNEGGLKGLFFSIKKRLELSIQFASGMVKDLRTSSSVKKS